MTANRLALLLSGSILTGCLHAQIDRMNYRQWAWLQQQNRVLLESIVKLPIEKQIAVADSFLRNAEQLPLLTVARTIAVARGIDADGGFYFRSGLQVFALPEACGEGRDLDVTIWAPYLGMTGKFPSPKKFAFELRVTDAKGKVVRRAKIQENDEVRDLREFRSTCKIPLAGLADGAYHVHVDTILDGEKPRKTDLPLGAAFAVMRDYAERAGRFRLVGENQQLAKALREVDPLRRAILQGASEYASRAWFGVPGVSPSHAVPDLLCAETIRKNIATGEFPLKSVGGFATIALPVEDAKNPRRDVVFTTLRLPTGGLPAKGSEGHEALARKPLMLVMPSIPVLDHADRRPSFPHYTLPGYLVEALKIVGFDKEQAFQLVVVESPGRMKHTLAGMVSLLSTLAEVFPFDADRIVLIGEGHGASGVVDLAMKYPRRVRGLVLVNATGGLASPQLRTLRELPILAIAGHSPSAKQSIDLLQTYAKSAENKKLEVLQDKSRPWCLAVPMAARQIEAFGRRVTK